MKKKCSTLVMSEKNLASVGGRAKFSSPATQRSRQGMKPVYSIKKRRHKEIATNVFVEASAFVSAYMSLW